LLGHSREDVHDEFEEPRELGVGQLLDGEQGREQGQDVLRRQTPSRTARTQHREPRVFNQRCKQGFSTRGVNRGVQPGEQTGVFNQEFSTRGRMCCAANSIPYCTTLHREPRVSNQGCNQGFLDQGCNQGFSTRVQPGVFWFSMAE